MRRYCSDSIEITVSDTDLTEFDAHIISVAQGAVLIEKEPTVTAHKATCTLDQGETAQFEAGKRAWVQLNVATDEGTRAATPKLPIDVLENLHGEEM